MEFKVEMVYERSTKRTHRFMETGNNPKIGTLYVQKHAFEGTMPKRIEASVKVLE